MIERKAAIEIRQVANGYLVRLPSEPVRHQEYEREFLVFQSFAELSGYLAGHFSHRAESLTVD